MRLIVLSDDRVIAEDAALIARDAAPTAEAVIVASMAEAAALIEAPAAPTAILMVEPRRDLHDHPIALAARARGMWLVVISEDARSFDGGDDTKLLGVQVPFTADSLGTVISRIVRDRPQG
ncbi:hypothetical protein ROJ8625_03572 [Roseivivax jejudonensis]|uniref:Response regulatory domain-containing protein n=1 Tax=Roseivivax jejudonensis TaxID=1529041 RepID=A0A1X7A2G2_9RHOB|nr:hypothetical protein [Roseivivax jejudonensis]SLN68714.1 hypothetical protein ROJ8625_03572 [Roseivivax jejudonensis]